MDYQKIIDLFNQMKIEEVSASCGEIEYILVANNNENIDTLHKIGITDEDIKELGYCEDLDDEYIDITTFAFRYADMFNGEDMKFYIEERVF